MSDAAMASFSLWVSVLQTSTNDDIVVSPARSARILWSLRGAKRIE